MNEFIYENEKIIQNIKKNISNIVIKTEKIEYVNGLPSKIIINSNEYNSIIYANNTIKEIINTKIFDNGYEEKYIYKFTFEGNKIKRIESYYIDDPNSENTIQIFEYISNNISKVIKKSTIDNVITEEITTYSDYDNQINTFSKVKVPLLELIPQIYSSNNYRKIEWVRYINGVQSGTSESTFKLEYDINGLPNYAEYKCQ